MFDRERFKVALANYKKDFPRRVNIVDVGFWTAPKTFQDNWNIDADNFYEMFSECMSDYSTYFGYNREYEQFAYYLIKNFPNETKKSFVILFCESKSKKDYTDSAKRIIEFCKWSNQLLIKKANNVKALEEVANLSFEIQCIWKTSFYLWLHYPDKYCPIVSNITAITYFLKNNHLYKLSSGLYRFDFSQRTSELINEYYKFADEIFSEIKKFENRSKFFQKIFYNEWQDEVKLNLRTIVYDFFLYIEKNYSKLMDEVRNNI